MKNLIILFAVYIIFSWDNIHAQYFNFWCEYENLDKYTVVDSAYLKCSFKLTYIKDTIKPSEKSTDLQILQIGKTISKYYSQYKVDYCNNAMEEERKGAENIHNIKEDGAWSYEVFKNYPQGKETVADVASMLIGNFIYEEDLPVSDWKLTDEKQTILSYSCRKATVSFRGRDFIAWFAPDIPLPNGPWKLGGLPGLILKLSDTKNNFVFECTGIEHLKNKEPIKFYKLEYAKLNRNDLNKLYERFHDNFVTYIRSALGSQYKDDLVVKVPYNPIELE